MIEKDKSYSYEELKEIFKKAQKEVFAEELDNMSRPNENGEKVDGLMLMLISVQNMNITAALYKKLFKNGDE